MGGNFALRVVSYPTTWLPVPLQDAKDFMRVSHDYDDASIAAMITAATRIAENKMHRAVVPQVLEYRLDEFPGAIDPIELPRPPLSTASSYVTVTYIDSSGSTSTLASTAYSVDYRSEPGRILPVAGNTWPNVGYTIGYPAQVDLAVTVTYRCGYEASSAIPEPIRHWIMMRAASMYENRSAVSDRAVHAVARDFVDGLLDPYVVI